MLAATLRFWKNTTKINFNTKNNQASANVDKNYQNNCSNGIFVYTYGL